MDLLTMGVLAYGAGTLYLGADWITTNVLHIGEPKLIIDANNREERRELKVLAKELTHFAEIQMPNKEEKVPQLLLLEYIPEGIQAIFSISGICDFETFAKQEDFLKNLAKCKSVELENPPGYVLIRFLFKEVQDLPFTKIPVTNTQLVIGYDYNLQPIIVDMAKTPHIGVVGLSLSGKTRAMELALENTPDRDIILINCMEKDFTNLPEATRYISTEDMLNCLTTLLGTGYHERPLYVVIDEYNVLSNIKTIDKAIQDLLSQARHFNIYVIVIMQLGNKEDCKFKNLFNVRIVFRTIDEPTVRAFLGMSTNHKVLQDRKFIIFHSKLERGISYFRK